MYLINCIEHWHVHVYAKFDHIRAPTIMSSYIISHASDLITVCAKLNTSKSRDFQVVQWSYRASHSKMNVQYVLKWLQIRGMWMNLCITTICFTIFLAHLTLFGRFRLKQTNLTSAHLAVIRSAQGDKLDEVVDWKLKEHVSKERMPICLCAVIYNKNLLCGLWRMKSGYQPLTFWKSSALLCNT